MVKKTYSRSSVCQVLHSLSYVLDFVYDFMRRSKPGSTKTIKAVLRNVGGEIELWLDEGRGERMLLDQ